MTAEEYCREKINPRLDKDYDVHLTGEELFNLMEAYAAQQSKIPTEDMAIRNFFIWMVRKANIDVIDAENAIEVHSLREPSTGLVPVVSIDELIKMYRNQITER